MAAQIESLVLAEGVIADARGSVTLVGFNPIGVPVPTVPWQVQMSMVVTLREPAEAHTALVAGNSATFSPLVKSPSGVTLVAGSGVQVFGDPQVTNPDGLQHLVQAFVVVGVSFVAPMVGEYQLSMSIDMKDHETLNAETSVWVHQADGATSPKAIVQA